MRYIKSGLTTVFLNGELLKGTTLEDIRKRIKESLWLIMMYITMENLGVIVENKEYYKTLQQCHDCANYSVFVDSFKTNIRETVQDGLLPEYLLEEIT